MRHVQKRMLSTSERRNLQAEINMLEQQIRTPDLVDIGAGGVPVYEQNQLATGRLGSDTAQRIQLLKRQLEAGSVEDLSRGAKTRRERRIKELEEKIAKRMIPRSHYFAKQNDSKDYHKVVDQIVADETDPQHKKDCQELKNLLRERSQAGAQGARSAEDPKSGSLEYLRPN